MAEPNYQYTPHFFLLQERTLPCICIHFTFLDHIVFQYHISLCRKLLFLPVIWLLNFHLQMVASGELLQHISNLWGSNENSMSMCIYIMVGRNIKLAISLPVPDP